jgi:predicted RNA-binding protein with PUA-like domain
MSRAWLIKSESDVYAIADLARDGHTAWEGVRNYEARNFMRDAMKPGELAFFYHSNSKPSGIAGLARIVKVSVPDPTQFNKKSEYYDPTSTKAAPRWQMIEVEFVERFERILSLERLKAESALAKMPLLQKGSRLSVQPVEDVHFAHILKLARLGSVS